jgi:hypothetical protein
MLERERLQQCNSIARSSSAGAIKPAPTQIRGRPIPESSAVFRTRQRERGRDSPAADDPPGPASSVYVIEKAVYKSDGRRPSSPSPPVGG